MNIYFLHKNFNKRQRLKEIRDNQLSDKRYFQITLGRQARGLERIKSLIEFQVKFIKFYYKCFWKETSEFREGVNEKKREKMNKKILHRL